MRQPSWRRASTKSPIGRSCMRGTPESSKSPPSTASAAVSGRIAVPALPMKNLAGTCGSRPSSPSMVTVVPSCCTPQPSWRRAASMTRVSSESSRSCKVVRPRHRAASSRTRLEMLLDPGRTTRPCAPASGGRSRNSVEYIGRESPNDGACSCSSAHGPGWPVRSALQGLRRCRWRSSTPGPAGCAGRSWTGPAALRGWRS